MDDIVIVNYKRTPLGAFQGCLSSFSATDLGSFAIKGCIEDINSNLKIDEVIMGCVLPAGLGQAPARQAAIKAGLDASVNAVTVNKVCGSGMQSIIFASDSIKSERNKIVIAGGMESMTNSPYLVPKARQGLRIGHSKLIDHMFFDGLEDAYSNNKLMGEFAEDTAESYSFSRESQDEYAKNSAIKAKENLTNLSKECVKITVKTKKDETIISCDETPSKVNIDKIPTLRPAFKKDGTVTAASSSSIADGAGAVLMMKKSHAKKLGLNPIAKIVATSSFSQDPKWFTTAPIGAMKDLFAKTGWSAETTDLFEINEAFAVVAMSAIKDLNISPDKVNVFGGACALGHPLGASGCRITITLINALISKGLKRGIASLCVGGGEATGIAIEII